jgi:flagellar basal body rod protein FlgC
MGDLLNIGASATELYRQALSTVSNNIANLSSGWVFETRGASGREYTAAARRQLHGYGSKFKGSISL